MGTREMCILQLVTFQSQCKLKYYSKTTMQNPDNKVLTLRN